MQNKAQKLNIINYKISINDISVLKFNQLSNSPTFKMI